MQAEAGAENTYGGKGQKILAAHMMNHRMVAAEGRPTSCGPLVFLAFASACIFCFCSILYFLLFAHLLCMSGPAGAKNPIVFQRPCQIFETWAPLWEGWPEATSISRTPDKTRLGTRKPCRWNFSNYW